MKQKVYVYAKAFLAGLWARDSSRMSVNVLFRAVISIKTLIFKIHGQSWEKLWSLKKLNTLYSCSNFTDLTPLA